MSEFSDRIDALTVDDFRRIGSYKWSKFPEAIGAFVAEMDFGLAAPIKRAVQEMLDIELTGYNPPALREELQIATAEFVGKRYGWNISPSQVYGLPDVLSGLTILLQHFARPGAVVVPTPAYMPFIGYPATYGRELIELPMIATESGWEFDFDGLARAFEAGASVLVMCNPHNPIGKVYSADEMRQIAEIVERYDGIVFNDEIHAPLTYAGVQHVPYPSVSDAAARHSITAMSASKSFNIAGFKCAELILTNPEHQKWCETYALGLPYGPAGIGAAANIAAFREGDSWLQETIDYLQGNRDRALELIGERLPGVRVRRPDATFLLWLDCRELGLDDPYAHFMAGGVAMNAGPTCGEVGKGHVRFNFATSRPVVEQAIELMAASIS